MNMKRALKTASARRSAKYVSCLLSATVLTWAASPVLAQTAETSTQGQQVESVGRGWPVELEAAEPGPGGFLFLAGRPTYRGEAEGVVPVGAAAGEVPEGITPLEVDFFTTEDFYQDQELWTDPRYFRCASSHAMEGFRGGFPGAPDMLQGEEVALEDAPWGHCDRDYGVEEIVSPYDFDSAQEHFDALKAEAGENGGPTEYTASDLPDWSGRYNQNSSLGGRDEVPFWTFGAYTQLSSFVSLLTPEYQTRLVQERYHEAVTNATQWPGSYCWPEGLTRWWFNLFSQPTQVIMNPDLVTFIGGGVTTFLRQTMVDAEFPMTEGGVPRFSDVPAWYGETVGFWDGDALITWTSNVQPWTNHAMFEFSDQLQIVEIWTPRTDESGAFVGLRSEAIFYDSEALVEPIRAIVDWDRLTALNEGNPAPWIECLQTLYPVDGRATPVAPNTTIEFNTPDWYGRPWAQIWEENFEEGLERPSFEEELFGF
jgi:hypothetical protein